VSGQVIGFDGAPVSGARVRLGPGGSPRDARETMTGQEGSFRFEGVQDGSYELWAEAEGFAGSEARLAAQVAGQPLVGIELRLLEGSALTGQVLGLEAALLPEVFLQARGPEGERRGVATDGEGFYRFENVAPGSWTVTASLSTSGRQVTERTTIAADATETRLDLEFPRGLGLGGHVIQGDLPLAGVRVSARGVDVQSSGQVETDQDGRFDLEGLEPGSYRISVVDWSDALSHEESVSLQQDTEITIEIPVARITGRVVEAASEAAIAGATVSLAPENGGAAAGRPSFGAVSRTDGTFEMERVGDGSYRLTAVKDGYATATLVVRVTGGRDLSGQEIALDSTEGLILDLGLAGGGHPSSVRVAVLDAGGIVVSHGSHPTGEGGRVRLDTVPAGYWTVVVSAAGAGALSLEANAPGGPLAIVLPPACDVQVVIPELVGTREVASVSLIDERGRRFRSVGWGGPQSTWRATGGQIGLGAVPPGVWRVEATAAEGRTWQTQVTTTEGVPAQAVLE
jgi:hypothetical protein